MNLQQFGKQHPDLPQLWGDISATRLSSPIHMRGKVQSLLWTFQKLIYSRRDWIQLCTSFYKNKWHFCPKKCQASVKWWYRFFAYWQKESEEFTLLFPSVKCPFIALHTRSCFATCFSTSWVHNLSHLHPLLFWAITSLPVEELLNTDGMLQQRASIAECAMISNPSANSRLTQIPKNMVYTCVWNIRIFKQSRLLLQPCDCSLPSRKDLLIVTIKSQNVWNPALASILGRS